MRVVRVLSKREFEAEGELDLGVFVRAGDVIAVSSDIRQEENEIVSYLGEEDIERLRSFLPDLEESRILTRFIVLMDLKGGLTKTPKVGDEIALLSDEEVKKAHMIDGSLKIPYMPYLIRKDLDVARAVLLKLIDLFPEEKDVLEMILAEADYAVMRGVDL